MSDRDIVLEEVVDVEKKVPRRIIHFVSGETLEEYSTEEEEEEEEKVEFCNVDTAKMAWGTYLKFWVFRIATSAFFTCEFLGGRLANLFGLNVPKYQYAIDEYYRREDEESDDGEDVTEKGVPNVLNEKRHFQIQSVEYGAIHPSQENPTYSGNNTQSDAKIQHSDTIPH
ncbi:protein FAM177B isoform X2 [Ascaphus truei]|uniref:protein FAM177B isoform X2 n=1 Tax=Ascaphus truei TaxID=8439 RepID=UPI003F593916